MHRHPNRSSSRSLLVGAALALGTALIAAQTPTRPQATPPSQERPTFKAEANFVRVDVYPTKGGVPVMDLRAEDFEVLEDGVPQSIQAFEHVVIRGAFAADQRAEPNTIEQSNQLAANPRNRVFVLFLDVPHVTMGASWNIREPIIRLIDRILSPDDLVGVMTPMMSASELVLARKTDVLKGGLRDRWPWGERSTLQKDDRERLYELCYPPLSQEQKAGMSVSAVAREMTDRRRERRTLDAMKDLVQHLRDIREERKAIITVSEGWLLYRPNNALTTLRTDNATGQQEPVPGPPPIVVGPDGRLTTKDTRNPMSGDQYECNSDRMRLAAIDDDQYFRGILGEANRGNASFYTVDPRGLASFDSPIGPEPPPPLHVDLGMLRTRQNAMRTLAENTDGMAVMNSNDLDSGLRRIADDLSSYYLLGYYSTNTKLDGKYRALKVSVKLPGVEVRARRGYTAATAAEVTAARTAAAAPMPEIVSTVASAIGSLDRVRPDARLHLNAVAGPAGPGGISTVWVAGELRAPAGLDPWARGGTADVEVTAGGRSVTTRVTLAAGERGFVALLNLPSPASAGAAEVKVRLAGSDPAAERATESARIDLGSVPGQPLLFRRGPSTGNKVQPVATFQFNRSERLRLESPVTGEVKAGSARLLGKTGQPVAVPIAVGEKIDDATGQHWITAELILAPLAMGDYAIELTFTGSTGEQRVITPFRLTR